MNVHPSIITRRLQSGSSPATKKKKHAKAQGEAKNKDQKNYKEFFIMQAKDASGNVLGEWLRVPHVHLKQSGIDGHITHPETRMCSEWVYLAQSDAEKFMSRIAELLPDQKIRFRIVTTDKETLMRNAPYSRALLMFIPLPGRKVRVGNVVYMIRIQNGKTVLDPIIWSVN
jgi:hypothetical protein